MHTLHSNILDIQKTGHRAQYTVGRLMSPEEVEQATEGHDPLKRRRVRGHWLLCGNCSQQMLDAIARENEDSLRYAFGVFASPEGTQFMLVTHQLESAQHRFLVPLWDPRVPDFLDALSQGRITIALARKGDTQALVWPAAADAPLAQRLRHHLHVPGQRQLQALRQTLPELIEQAAEPQQLPTLVEGQAVTDVSVSIVFDALLPRLGKLLEQEAMKKGATLH